MITINEEKSPVPMSLEDIKNMTAGELELRLEEDRVRTVLDVLAHIQHGETTFINDHNENTETLQGVVVLANSYICPVWMYSLCCLNRLYIGGNDKKIHLSTTSVGGNFGRCSEQTDGSKESFIKEAVKYYNETMIYGAKIIEHRII